MGEKEEKNYEEVLEKRKRKISKHKLQKKDWKKLREVKEQSIQNFLGKEV